MIQRDKNGRFINGSTALMKGKKRVDIQDENHPLWKGDEVSYGALHDWIRYHKGNPTKCELCGTEISPKFEWANISGEYKRDLDDYIRLCGSCHKKMDRVGYKSWVSRGLSWLQ